MNIKYPENKKLCPLLNKEIYWGGCVEIQEVRDDSMDMELCFEKFDLEKSNDVCEKCRWYYVDAE